MVDIPLSDDDGASESPSPFEHRLIPTRPRSSAEDVIGDPGPGKVSSSARRSNVGPLGAHMEGKPLRGECLDTEHSLPMSLGPDPEVHEGSNRPRLGDFIGRDVLARPASRNQHHMGGRSDYFQQPETPRPSSAALALPHGKKLMPPATSHIQQLSAATAYRGRQCNGWPAYRASAQPVKPKGLGRVEPNILAKADLSV